MRKPLQVLLILYGLLITANLADVINLSWHLVFAPLYLLVGILGCFAVVVIVMYVAWKEC